MIFVHFTVGFFNLFKNVFDSFGKITESFHYVTAEMIPQNLSPPSSNVSSGSVTNADLKTVKRQTKNGVSSESRKRASLKTKRNSPVDENIVQWKQKNIKDGFVVVDEAQLSKLIKREPIEKYYKLEQEPFAKGLFASVRRCQSLETGENFAAKFSSKRRYGEDCSAEIYHEIALLSLCGSAPRVIQIHDVFENKNEIIIVMEYAPGGDLQTIIDDNMVPFESDVVSFIRQTVEGLDYLHKRKIAHLDIKPQNIVMMGDFPNCEIKLCDFEISRVILDGTDIREILGTPDYVAPEILHYDPITLAADMWSLGVTTYVLLTGFSPFGGETDQETFCNISRGDLDLPEELFEDISGEALDFIKSLLVKDPMARLTAAACLKHPWLSISKTKSTKAEATPQPLLRHDSDPITGELYTKSRTGCQTCQPPKEPDCKHEATDTHLQNEKALRKYLSKSREALFEKVIQQHKNNNNLRKSTIKNQFFNKTRLCESQISLISKSREKLLNNENLSPSFSRSIEKIYGLRSLSKSQEVLNLYKNGSLLTSQENINIVSEILKSRENLIENTDNKKLTRATTADIGVLRHRNKHSRMYSYSSTTSISSIATQEEDEDVMEDEFKEEDTKITIKDEKTKDPDLIKEIEKLEESRKVTRRHSEEDDEPRFTVAQLVTAFNKHQEIVTKTSLEVTMTAQEKEVKIPPIIPYKSKSTFPTGPTALRLFIPDIDLVELPKKSRPKYKIRFFEDRSDTSEPNSGDWSKIKDTESSGPASDDFELPKKEESPKYLRSSSVSSEASTTVSLESSNSASTSSWEEITKKEEKSSENKEKQSPENVSKEEAKEEVKQKPPKSGRNLTINQKRSKSTSPCKDVERIENQRKLSAGSYPSKSEDFTLSRKLSNSKGKETPTKVSSSPLVRRKSSQKNSSPTSTIKQDPPSQFKIIGMREESPSPCSKGYGISYKIEFDSPVVTRKFPSRNLSSKGTISSTLKAKDSSNLKNKKK